MKTHSSQQILFSLFSFFATILLVRGTILILSFYNIIPSIHVRGMHIHHFVFGFLFLAIGAVMLSSSKSAHDWPFIFFGIGLALAFDEFEYWATFDFSYWTMENYFAIAALALAIIAIYLYKYREETEMNLYSRRLSGSRHYNPPHPKVSVVIPAFNEERFIHRTLLSLARQNYKNFELIVVDNNSTDATAKIARGFGAKVLSEPRLGVAHARQTGFSSSRGEIIATTDADTIVPVDWVGRIVSEFEKDEDLAAFGGLYGHYSGSMIARLTYPHIAYLFWRLDRRFAGGWSLPGSNLAVRKNSFYYVGGFNTKLHLGEDADLSQRLRKAGKVELDRKFLVATSGRRFRKGLIKGMKIYVPNIFARLFLKDSRNGALPAVRNEASPIRTVIFPLALVSMVLTLFFLANSGASARETSIYKTLVPNTKILTHSVIQKTKKTWHIYHQQMISHRSS